MTPKPDKAAKKAIIKNTTARRNMDKLPSSRNFRLIVTGQRLGDTLGNQRLQTECQFEARCCRDRGKKNAPVTNLDHVICIVTDVERSRRFYRDVFGLRKLPPPYTFDFVVIGSIWAGNTCTYCTSRKPM